MIPAVAELAQHAQWIYWIAKPAKPKPRKIPMSASTGRAASSTDPSTWSTYEAARQRSDQVGFVFCQSDPFCGIDLDCCRDPETGAIAPAAQRIIDELASYTEISPSATGVKIFVRAALAAGGRNEIGWDWEQDAPLRNVKKSEPQAEIAIFDRARYFTVTGHHLAGTPETIEERQAQVDALRARLWPTSRPQPRPRPAPPSALNDDEVVERARRANKSFGNLWAGSITGYASASEADMALAQILAFWCGDDAVQIRRLITASGLWTEEHIAKHPDVAKYLDRTIKKAIGQQREHYRPGASRRASSAKRTSSSSSSHHQHHRSGDTQQGAAAEEPPPPPAPPPPPLTDLERLNRLPILKGITIVEQPWRGRSGIILQAEEGRIILRSGDLLDFRKARAAVVEACDVMLVSPGRLSPRAAWEPAAALILRMARDNRQMALDADAEQMRDILRSIWRRIGELEAESENGSFAFMDRLSRTVVAAGSDCETNVPCIWLEDTFVYLHAPTVREVIAAARVWPREFASASLCNRCLELLEFSYIRDATRRSSGSRAKMDLWRGPRTILVREMDT